MGGLVSSPATTSYTKSVTTGTIIIIRTWISISITTTAYR